MISPLHFPNLQIEGFTPRSPLTPRYNCIAWAAGESHRWWDPMIGYYWPVGAPRAPTLEAYIQAFGVHGFEECEGTECRKPLFEPKFQRVALYAASGLAKHAARQIDEQRWTSKLGKSIDLEHTLRGLEGPFYGRVSKILKRPLPQATA
jgi:hypothetical protein